MENSLVGLINTFFAGLKIIQRWVALIFLFGFAMIILQEYESLTGQFELNKIERKVHLLKELQSINSANIQSDPELEKIYQNVVDDLSRIDTSKSLLSKLVTINLNDRVTIGKALSGASLLMLALIFAVGKQIAEKDFDATILITLFLLIPTMISFAWIATLIPTIYNPWINYLGFPVLQIGILNILARLGNKLTEMNKSKN